jgi:hypothetical protein
LVILPNKDFERANALKAADIARGVKLGGQIVPWKAVGFANLNVSVEKNGIVKVSKIGRCPFCERDYPLPRSWNLTPPL